LLGARAKYITETGASTREAVSKLLDTLSGDGDEKLRLVEVNLRQAPLAGAPSLVLKSAKSGSLSPAVKALRDRQVPLFEELDDVEQIGLMMEQVTGKSKRSYIFRLQFEAVDGSYLVRYTCGRLATQLRTQFEVHMEERYDVRVVPTA
jgi:hypothetical protein